MKQVRNMKTYLTPTAAAVALAISAGSAQAIDVYLAAKAFTTTMPDGSTVPMWGYVEDTAGCHAAGSAAARLTCVGDQLGDPVLPGPPIVVDPSEAGALTIHLSNGLPEPTSIVITGQALPASSISGPTWDDGSTGPRSNANQRVRSFGSEAAANGGYESYTWTIARSGSFIYHSGTHPQKQVYMGMYGPVMQDAANGEVFDGVPYQNQIVLFYSDIDPDLNRSIARLYDPGNPDYAGVEDYSTSIDMHARWHLVNGEPYEPGVTADLVAVAARPNLLRLFSTASETVVPTLQGHYMDIHAEDGFRYNWQDGGTPNYVARTQYSAKLPALKTKDAILVPEAQGRFSIYEGGGHMTNPTDPGNPNEGDDTGGMLRFVDVTAPPNNPPLIDPEPVDQVNNVGDMVALQITADDPDIPFGDTLSYAAAPLPAGMTINPATGLISGTISAGAAGVYGPTVTVTDNVGDQDSAMFTWTVNAAPNHPPTVEPIADQTNDEGDLVSLQVVASDADADDVLSYAAALLPDGVTIDMGTGLISGTIAGGAAGGSPYSVQVDVTDGTDVSNISFTWTVAQVLPVGPLMYLSTAGNTGIPGAAGPYDNSDIYNWDGAAFARIFDRSTSFGGGANVDGLAVIDNTHFYVSFANTTVTVPLADGQGGTVDTDVNDEDILYYDNGSWSLAYVGADVCGGLAGVNGRDIDAFDIVGGVLYFSTAGNTQVPGVGGPYDSSDIYSWDGTACQRIFDRSASGVGGANIDAMAVIDNNHFYVSFANTTVTVPLSDGQGGTVDTAVNDENVVEFNAGTWTLYFDGTAQGLTENGQDLDAIDVP